MPDAEGRFKGIAIPELPWHRPKPPRRPKIKNSDTTAKLK